MPDVQQQLESRFRDALARALGPEHADADPMVRASTNPKFGDYQANVAMSLGKQLGRKPRDVAEAILAALDVDGVCIKTEIAGPGFINLHLEDQYVADQLRAGIDVKVTSPQKVVVDYSGPNVAKEMHVGHLRSTIIGDTIVRILAKQGHEVQRQNHLGDWGTQFGRVMLGLWYEAVASKRNEKQRLAAWMRQAMELSRKPEKESPEQFQQRKGAQDQLLQEILPWQRDAFEEDIEGHIYFEPYVQNQFPDLQRLQELYTFASAITDFPAAKEHELQIRRDDGGFDLKSFAQLPSHIATFVQKPGEKRNGQEAIAWHKSVAVTVTACQAVYRRLGVLLNELDVRGESSYKDLLAGVITGLKDAGLLRDSDGAKVVFPEGFADREGQPLPLIVRKSDGGYLYATTDLAAARYRIHDLGAKRLVYVTDARQSQHFAMVFKTLRDAKWAGGDVRLEHVPFGTVLGADRKPFKTREGGTVKLVDLLDEAEQRAAKIIEEKKPELSADDRARIAHVVGIGALKYADLSSDRIKDYVFDWDRMLAFDGNTAPYIQNAYVRVRAIFRKAKEQGVSTEVGSDAIALADPAERALAVKLLQFGGAIATVADSLEPHRLCTYLYELASAFHQFYERCPVLSTETDAPTRASRLALSDLTSIVLRDGLSLLGIDVFEQM